MDSKGNYNKAIEYFEKCLAIEIKSEGEFGVSVAVSYNNISQVLDSMGNYLKALEYYQKILEINLKNFGEKHPDIATSYFDIGCTLKNLKRYDIAIENFKKGYQIEQIGGYPFNIALCYEALNDKVNALDYYIQSAEIRKEDQDLGIKADSTQESISNSIRLAIELDKENELPVWMKNNN